MKFVVFHGAFGSPESNWIPELEEKLKTLGQEVVVPRLLRERGKCMYPKSRV